MLSIELSEKLEYQKGKADGLFNLGNCYYIPDESQPTINANQGLKMKS